MAIITISCEETGTFVTLESGEENQEALTITSTSDDLATPRQAQHFLRTWADAVEQEQFAKAPRALQDVLAVIKIWGQGAGAYVLLDATRRVAQAQGHSDDTTVRDAYTRRLGHLHVDDFDRLLDNPLALQDTLLRQYPEHVDVIESYMFYLLGGPI